MPTSLPGMLVYRSHDWFNNSKRTFTNSTQGDIAMENPFDDLTKKLAKKALTRRESLRWIGGGFIGAALATLGFGKLLAGEAGHPTCPDYCKSLGLSPKDTKAWGKCVSNCANCRDAGGNACGAGSCCFDDAVCCPEGTPGATCVSCGDGEEFDAATCSCVAVCCAAGPDFSVCDDNEGPFGYCICVGMADGSAGCVADDSCGNLSTCSSNSDCPSGYACSDTNNGCGAQVCVQVCDCNSGGGSGKRVVIPEPGKPTLASGRTNINLK
jgi:hypothetical protein